MRFCNAYEYWESDVFGWVIIGVLKMDYTVTAQIPSKPKFCVNSRFFQIFHVIFTIASRAHKKKEKVISRFDDFYWSYQYIQVLYLYLDFAMNLEWFRPSAHDNYFTCCRTVKIVVIFCDV